MIYDSSKRKNAALEEVVHAFQYRDLIANLVQKDITTRYKRSFLGILWTMLNPLGTMVVMTIVFSGFFHRQEFFSVYLLSGLLTWNFFSQTTLAIIKTMVWGEVLFQRIYVPRSTFALAAVGTGVVNLVLSIATLILVKLVIRSPLAWQAFFFPVILLSLASFSLGLGMIISSIALYFKDIVEMYQVVLMAWFYMTPIIYPYSALPAGVQRLLALNPMLYMVELMRDAFYYNQTPSMQEQLLVLGISVGTLLIGWLLFSRQTEEFVLRT